jgi:sec-independent protein translocase protein TatB
MFNLGFSELILLGVIALIFIGPDQLPEMARTLGRLLNEFKRASTDFQSSLTDTFKDDLTQRIEDSRKDEKANELISTAEGPEAIKSPMDLGPKIEHDEPPVKLPRGDGQS